jgi:hypothetical protein
MVPFVQIDPDLYGAFPSAADVNDALHLLLRVARETAAFPKCCRPRSAVKKQVAPPDSR